MSRVLKVVRLQLINRQTFIWIPLMILGGALALSLVIYAIIPSGGPKYGGGGQAPLWYFFALGMQALTLAFPFSQALSITRRDFFFGTMVTAGLGGLLLSILFVVGGWIEDLTHGWGINGYFFRLPWVWEAGPLVAGLTYFALAMLLFVIGFTGATIYKRWGGAATTIVGLGVGAILVGLVFLFTKFSLWGAVVESIGSFGAAGLGLCMLAAVAVLGGISYLVLRRATP